MKRLQCTQFVHDFYDVLRITRQEFLGRLQDSNHERRDTAFLFAGSTAVVSSTRNLTRKGIDRPRRGTQGHCVDMSGETQGLSIRRSDDASD